MSFNLKFTKHTLQFKFDAGTSRGVMKTKDAWILKISHSERPKVFGYGEVSVIERLSFDYQLDFENELEQLAEELKNHKLPKTEGEVYALVARVVEVTKPAIRFGLETALLDLVHGGQFQIFENDFYTQERKIPINGLIWMGDESFMLKQIEEKLQAGFRCIKMKIGAIDFETEKKLLSSIRKRFSAADLTLRVDANGAFQTQEVLKRLDELAQFDLHSIEQPIMPRQFHAMQLTCKRSPVPVALDEELIGVFDLREKRSLLSGIEPPFIILKPSLLGGFKATAEWISLAEELGIDWWITSALESNVGLNAICQFTAEYSDLSYQGLGTGQLYTNNFHAPLTMEGQFIYYHQNRSWDLSPLLFGK
ncbi:o-succinylbenzoate synthase [Reichenbachiella agariperforans]|uniref:O-succinylbenzoate synthase n=1 Tax=Reichenbachiella agariperforans TaxID=156994 RepID=A0A1M6R926_REIAG|nr:o-succinylbenzoate synthase [Reichenbachiella agariperforans]SHK28828.1 o-succinylbenzoate synthase [Reichenbachiella agariperforans]